LAQSRPILPLERGLEGSFGFVRMELGRNPSDRGNLSDRHVLDHSADATKYWRNFSNRPIEVAADEPRDLRRDVPRAARDIMPLREWSPLAILATTTLADLLTLPLVANPFSAMRTSLRWWSIDEFEDGVAHAWQNRLGRWPLIPFFPLAVGRRRMLEEGICDHRHEHDGEGLARVAPRSDRNRVSSLSCW
jgi:hypothetical protein